MTEWLERPQKTQESRWLMVLDNLSGRSAYPVRPSWVGHLNPESPKIQSWKELLSLLPSTSGQHGHIIITTMEDPAVTGPLLIPVLSLQLKPDTDLSTAGADEQQREIIEFWKEAETRTIEKFALILFLADPVCPWIPVSVLGHGEEDRLPVTSQPGADGRSLRGYALRHGPELLKTMCATKVVDMDKVAAAAWEAVSNSLPDFQVRDDMIQKLEATNDVVKTCGAVLQKYQYLVELDLLSNRKILQNDKIRWRALATAYEQQFEYGTACELYGFEAELRRSLDGGKRTDASVELDCARARMFHYQGSLDTAAEECQRILDENKDVDVGDLRRVPVYRELASVRAGQDRYKDAICEASRALGDENPFGRNACDPRVLDTVRDLIGYALQQEQWTVAGLLLERMLVAAELEHGPTHPTAVAMLEALAATRQLYRDREDAYRMLDMAWERKKKRLGPNHPAVIVCRFQMALACDQMENHGWPNKPKESAAKVYEECLALTEGNLTSSHPIVFAIRENLTMCWIEQGRIEQAREMLLELKADLDMHRRWYPFQTRKRFLRLLQWCKQGRWWYWWPRDGWIDYRNELWIGEVEYNLGSDDDDESWDAPFSAVLYHSGYV